MRYSFFQFPCLRKSVWFAGLFTCLLFDLPATAGPVAGLVFDDVSLNKGDEINTIKIGFNQPVQFVWHFPQQPGIEVLIQVRTFSMGADELSAWSRNESALLTPEARQYIEEIEFDPNEYLDPFVRVRFHNVTPFKIRQGRDWRSIEVLLPGDPSAGSIEKQERPTEVETEILDN